MTLPVNAVAMGMSASPYIAVFSGEHPRPYVPMVDLPGWLSNGGDFSPDGSKLAWANSNSPFLLIYNTADWSKIPNPTALPAGAAYACSFSADGSKLAVAHAGSPYITVYNVADWSKIANPATLPAGQGNGCAFSPDGSKLAVAHTTSPYLAIYNTSDWSKIANPATLPVGTGNDCAFSPDGSKLAVAHTTSPYLAIYNTSDWSKIANPATLPVGTGNGCAFSPDGSKLAVAHSGSTSALTVYNVADWSKINIDPLVIVSGSLSGRSVAWQSNTIVLVSSQSSTPGVYFVDVTTGHIVDTIDFPGSVLGLATMPKTQWEINGTITESLAATDWVAIAQDYETGVVLSSVEFTGTTFVLQVARPSPVSVTVFAKQGSMWKGSTPVTLGTKCFPTNPSATPYYYECTQQGTTGVSEPVFPITAGGTVTDGTVIWTRVERLIQPVTQSPLIPTVV